MFPRAFSIEGMRILDLCKKVMTLSDEVKITVSDQGWYVRAVDPAHVSMIEMSIPRTDFNTFEKCDMVFGIDVEKIAAYLKSLGTLNKESVKMTIDQQTNRMVFSSQVGERSINLVDTIGMTECKIPKLYLDAGITLDSAKSVMAWIKTAEQITDHVRLSLELPYCLTLQAYGEVDSAKFNLEGYDKTGRPAIALYPLDYFKGIIKALGNEKIRIEFSSDFPVKIQSLVTQTVFLLAPRIESE